MHSIATNCRMQILHAKIAIVSTVQIRDVPEHAMAALRRAAAARGESLQRYLWSVVLEQARIDATANVLAEAAEDARESAGVSFDAAEWVRAARDERGDDLATRHAQ